MGQANLLTTDLSFRAARALLIGAQSSYDLLQRAGSYSSWQGVGLRTEFTPKKDLALRTYSTYDTSGQAWSNHRLDLSYKSGPMFVSYGARYDGIRKVWGDQNLYVTGARWGRISGDVRIAYNGYLHRFDAQQYGVVVDLHCAEAVLQVVDMNTGFRPGREITFFLRLKALPWSGPLGTGRLGQPIGTGTGRDF